MIYRIHPNFYRYATYQLDSDDLLKKLGRYSVFGIEINAVHYTHQWQPIKFRFHNSLEEGPLLPIPDLIVDYGCMLLSEKSYRIFYAMLAEHGEFLPIYSGDTRAYLYNPLKIAEQFNGLDTKYSTKNEYDYVTTLHFIEEKLTHLPLFKCEYDNYLGIYCRHDFRDTFMRHNLRGIVFEENIALSFPADPAVLAED
ncbi:hypothetical protein [Agarilytica rhodophyticola]|uniref:hypothetical protein n=1 Tax=Agarilytica rhodophyticola TaxID=1737490 RepID=UPI000B3456E9|nr:hypothetical protein [Agarilytica rhodophyticola]